MAIFSRRIVQQMLNENASFLSMESLDQQVARLNTKGFQLIDTEWEVAVLNAFSKAGVIEHEAFGNSKFSKDDTTPSLTVGLLPRAHPPKNLRFEDVTFWGIP